MTMLFFSVLLLGGLGMNATAQDAFSNAEEVRPLLPGAAVPDVELTQLDGSTISVRDAAASKPTVLIFYRGGW